MTEKEIIATGPLTSDALAEKLAKRWDADVALARRAAWLHDITKEMPYNEQLQLVDKHGIILTDTQRSEKIIHAFSGALVADQRFGEPDEVCDVGGKAFHLAGDHRCVRKPEVEFRGDGHRPRHGGRRAGRLSERARASAGYAL